MALLLNECMLGMTRGFLADGDHTSGSTTTQINNIETLIGGPVQVVMLGGISNPTSLAGLGRHIVVHAPMIPNGGSIHVAATTGYASMWTQVVTNLNAAGRNNADTTIDFAWEGSGSNQWGGVNTFDPFTQAASTTQDWVAGFRNGVTTMRGAGLNSGVTIGWNVMSGNLTATQLAQMDPGTSYWDVGGWDGYAGNYLGRFANRNDYQSIYDGQQKKDLDTITKYCRDRGKRAGMGEMGFPQPIPGDTTSDAYTYRPADSYLYFQLFYNYFMANADVWAFACIFNQNVYGTSAISEDQQFVYLGTNPASMSYPSTSYKNTSSTGPAYLTTSPQHDIAKSLGSFLDYWGGRAGRGGGTCVLPANAPPPPPPTTISVVGPRLRPLRAHRGWIKG